MGDLYNGVTGYTVDWADAWRDSRKKQENMSRDTAMLLMKEASAPSHHPFSSTKHVPGDLPQMAELHGRVRSRGLRNLGRRSLCQRGSGASR